MSEDLKIGDWKPKHTVEPWNSSEREFEGIEGSFSLISDSYGNALMVRHADNAKAKQDSERAVECVNAMVGIRDPEEFVKDSRELSVMVGSKDMLLLQTLKANHEYHKRFTVAYHGTELFKINSETILAVEQAYGAVKLG